MKTLHSMVCRVAVASVAWVGPARADYISTVTSLAPLAYWRLDSNNANSLVNGYTTTYLNGAATSAAGTGVPLNGYPNNSALSLNGVNSGTPEYVTTGLSGGFNGTGTIVAWVNLGLLPSTSGHTFYIAGESQVGNDLDLQFQTDNKVYFFTGGGDNTSFAPSTGSLVGQWHQIVATYNANLGTSSFRDIYWEVLLQRARPGASAIPPKRLISRLGIARSLAAGTSMA